ncbi:MAG: alpha-isopropylmalate synthase regulatory domain-containing protein, partial [Mucinivorans sp.]
HNDYDLSVANSLAALRAGVGALHTTVNGLGERAGNAPLSSVLAVINDHTDLTTNLDESKLSYVSSVVESYSGVRIPANKPVIGENVFTQCAGIHADGDNKHNLYYNDLLPERFGRTRSYALGKTSGKANIRKNLEMLGIELDDGAMGELTQYIIGLGDKKEVVTSDDLPYIISDLFGEQGHQRVRILNYSLNLAQGLKPVATLKIEIDGELHEQTSTGDGQYDAFVSALRTIYLKQLGRDFPTLTDYSVSIPPGGRTDAFVQTAITWNFEGRVFKTKGLDVDQTEAAIKATIKMLNKI